MAATISFPEFFHQFNSHMIMSCNDQQDCCCLTPLNQCDWMYDMKKITDTMWIVDGRKDDVLSFTGPITSKYTYELVEFTWKCLYLKS